MWHKNVARENAACRTGKYSTKNPGMENARKSNMESEHSLYIAYKKAVLSQRRPRNAPYTWCPENFHDSLTTPKASFPNIFHRLLLRSTLWMFLQNLKYVALPVPDIIGGTQKLGSTWIHPCSLFSKIFNGHLFGLALFDDLHLRTWPPISSKPS